MLFLKYVREVGSLKEIDYVAAFFILIMDPLES